MLCQPCKDHINNLEQRISQLEKVVQQVLPELIKVSQESAAEAVEVQGKSNNLVVIRLNDNVEPSDFVDSVCEKLEIDRVDVVDTFRDGRSQPGHSRIVEGKVQEP